MNVVWPLSAQQGYEPDHVITADDVSHGRPAPWMLFRSAERLGVYPMRCIAAIDDTPVGIEAGRSAGCWTVAVVQSGNAMGLSPDELAALDSAELQSRVDRVTEIFRAAGADYVIPSVAELMPTIDAIDARLAAGESPPG
jgi:phosphonoacetaldehyde hydrolase